MMLVQKFALILSEKTSVRKPLTLGNYIALVVPLLEMEQRGFQQHESTGCHQNNSRTVVKGQSMLPKFTTELPQLEYSDLLISVQRSISTSIQ